MKKAAHIFMNCCLTAILCLQALVSCQKIRLPEFHQMVVVEGWIENGEAPIVQLTASIPPRQEKTSYQELQDYIIKDAQVEVTCEGKSYPLVCVRDDRFFPNAFIYTTDALKGEVGKTYGLKVVHGDNVVTASSTLPAIPELGKTIPEPVGEREYKICAEIIDKPAERDFYKFFIRRHDVDGYYQSSFLALYNDVLIGEEGRITATIANALGTDFMKFTPYFSEEDVVDVKLCAMEEDVFWYWKDCNDILAFSVNPFLTVNSSIRYNVQGGYGYWAAYGKVETTVSILP